MNNDCNSNKDDTFEYSRFCHSKLIALSTYCAAVSGDIFWSELFQKHNFHSIELASSSSESNIFLPYALNVILHSYSSSLLFKKLEFEYFSNPKLVIAIAGGKSFKNSNNPDVLLHLLSNQILYAKYGKFLYFSLKLYKHF
jgi:hypothetical protein